VHLTDNITDPRLAKALAHPLRLEILRVLGDRTASPSEIAAEIGAPLTNVSYHVRKLRALGVIKLVRKTPKRGVIEHYYSAPRRQQVSDEAWAQTPPIVKAALLGPVAKDATREILNAAENGGFARNDMHLSLNPMRVDEQGWKEVAALLLDTLDKITSIEEKSEQRIEEGAEPITSATVIALFERFIRDTPPDAQTAAAAPKPKRRATTNA
jgi:DNA-binding transcriptional ArsR family regulator